MKNNKKEHALSLIIAEAKEIKKAHPRKKWTNCVKEASENYNKNKKKG